VVTVQCMFCFVQKMGHFAHINDLTKVAGISLSVLKKNSSNLKCRTHQHHVLSSRKYVRHTDSRFVSAFHDNNYGRPA